MLTEYFDALKPKIFINPNKWEWKIEKQLLSLFIYDDDAQWATGGKLHFFAWDTTRLDFSSDETIIGKITDDLKRSTGNPYFI